MGASNGTWGLGMPALPLYHRALKQPTLFLQGTIKTQDFGIKNYGFGYAACPQHWGKVVEFWHKGFLF
jgi:hypothetical protein